MRCLALLLLALSALLATPEAAAQACTASVPALDFGNLTTPLPQSDVARTVTISCSSGAANDTARICMGIQPSGSPRLLQGPGGASIGYEIYADAGHTQVWDDSPLRTVMVALDGAGNGSATVTLYARMAGGSSPASGLYQAPAPGEMVFGLVKPGSSPCSSGGNTGSFTGTAFDARVLVNGACDITAAPLLDFGAVGGGTSPQVDGALQLTAQCTSGLPYAIALNAGQVPGNTIADRRLGLDGTGPGVIGYQLYLDSGRSQLWGDGTTGAVYDGTGTGADQAITVYGRVPAGQPLPAGGTYRDTVTATIVY